MIENISVKVDDVGRIVIPKKIRKELDININDILMLSVNDKKIEMEKRKESNKLESLIKKLETLTREYYIDIILTNNIKVVFSNIESLKDKKVCKDIKKIKTKKVIKENKTILTSDFNINTPHYYCSFYLDIYTKYNLFVIYKKEKNENLAKTICELLLI